VPVGEAADPTGEVVERGEGVSHEGGVWTAAAAAIGESCMGEGAGEGMEVVAVAFMGVVAGALAGCVEVSGAMRDCGEVMATGRGEGKSAPREELVGFEGFVVWRVL
jgi:hypothetical protein